MQFANTEMSWIMLALPLFGLFAWYAFSARRRRLHRLINDNVLRKLAPALRRRSRRNLYIDVFSGAVIVLLLCLTALRPQWGFSWKESTRKGVDIVITVDVSTSMLAQDISPNRLERARREILDLLDKLQGDRIALVAFAGVAFIEAPLTLDYTAFRLFLSQLDPALIPVRGTDLRTALHKSIDAFGPINEETSSSRERAILLITDGEHLEGDLEPIRLRLQQLGIGLFIMGIGTEEGAPIPLPGEYKKDSLGKLIISQLKPELLAELAQQTGGIYVQSITSDEDTNMLYSRGIKAMLSGSEIQGSKAKLWNEYFQLPLLAAVLLMIAASLARRFQVRRAPDQVEEGSKGITELVIFLALLPIATGWALPAKVLADEGLGREAHQAFEHSHYNDALDLYSEGTEANPGDFRFHMGQGASAYRLGQYEAAASSFQEAGENGINQQEQAEAVFNLGNALVQLGRFKHAVTMYEKGLSLTQSDRLMRENLQYTKKLIEQQQQKNKQDEDKKDQDKKDQDKQDQEQEEQKDQEQQKGKNKDQDQEKNKDQDKEQNKDQDKEQEQDKNQDQDKDKDKDKEDSENKQDQSDQDKEKDKDKDKQQDKEEDKQQDKGKNQDKDEGKDDKDTQPEKSDGQDKDKEKQKDKGNNLDKDKDQDKDKNEDKEQDKDQDKNKEKEQDKEQKQGEPGQDSSAKTAGDTETEQVPVEVSDQVEALLDSLRENKAELAAYRNYKAREQLQEMGHQVPTRDW